TNRGYLPTTGRAFLQRRFLKIKVTAWGGSHRTRTRTVFCLHALSVLVRAGPFTAFTGRKEKAPFPIPGVISTAQLLKRRFWLNLAVHFPFNCILLSQRCRRLTLAGLKHTMPPLSYLRKKLDLYTMRLTSGS